jgi:hypothetical protein
MNMKSKIHTTYTATAPGLGPSLDLVTRALCVRHEAMDINTTVSRTYGEASASFPPLDLVVRVLHLNI